MTEVEWHSCTNPAVMMEFLRGKVSERKLRLLACAIVRAVPFHRDGRPIWHLLPGFEWFRGSSGEGPLDCHEMVEIAERRAEGHAGHEEWGAARELARDVVSFAEADTSEDDPAVGPGVHLAGSFFRLAAAQAVAHVVVEDRDDLCRSMFTYQVEDFYGDRRSRKIVCRDFDRPSCALVREVFGDPIRPAALDRARLTTEAVALARSIDGGRAFERMPDLARALEAADHRDPDILAHCRSEGPHVRGCWALDAILGKD